MPHLQLDRSDYTHLLRTIIFNEIKRLRNISDIFGDELTLHPQRPFVHQKPAFTATELRAAGARVAEFFGLNAEDGQRLGKMPSLEQWSQYLEGHVGPRPHVITFSTSGSTGTPKSVKRDYAHLEEDALCLTAMLPNAKRIVGLVPPHHIYGFIHTVLLPKALGLPRLDLRFQPPSSILRALTSGDVVMGFPHIWKGCAETEEPIPPDVQGMTSTGPCPTEVIHALRRNGLKSMIEIYGSSENGAIAHRLSPEAPLTLMGTWRRVGTSHVERVNAPAKHATPFSLQDVLNWVDETRFFIVGRRDNAVQVGGVNVYPSRVREVLLQAEVVEDCAVRLMRPEEGSRLKAFVVPRVGITPGHKLRDDLRTYLTHTLSAPEMPTSITFGPAIPKNDMGKETDWDIEGRTDSDVF